MKELDKVDQYKLHMLRHMKRNFDGRAGLCTLAYRAYESIAFYPDDDANRAKKSILECINYGLGWHVWYSHWFQAIKKRYPTDQETHDGRLAWLEAMIEAVETRTKTTKRRKRHEY